MSWKLIPGQQHCPGQIDYGVELVSTNGMDARFDVIAFTLTAN